MKEKTLRDLTFEELVNVSTGSLIVRLGAGDKLRSIMFNILNEAVQWRIEQDKKLQEAEANVRKKK
jgi:hypothetical protein